MRGTRLHIDTDALLHNFKVIQAKAPQQKIIAMVKSNAYGCGLETVVRQLHGWVYAFGVAFLAEAMQIRRFGVLDPCVLFEGIHEPCELKTVSEQGFELVIHHPLQLEWLLNMPCDSPIKVWIKINTGMNRLGFKINQFDEVLRNLKACPWVDSQIGLMTHFACADTPQHPLHQKQINDWQALIATWDGPLSAVNSAAIWTSPSMLGSHIRPGLALYGASPIPDVLATELHLKPVMTFSSVVMAIQSLEADESIGYGATYVTQRISKIAVVAVGYGDGYPRHIKDGTFVQIGSYQVPIVGRVSMDKVTVDITDCSGVQIGDPVELWGAHISIEYVAKQAGTIPYELMCQVGPRERLLNLYL